MDCCYAWCKGGKFVEICKMTSIYEGTIVRMFRRLHEFLGELIIASQSMENQILVEKFQDCCSLVKRDIVFAASLYL